MRQESPFVVVTLTFLVLAAFVFLMGFVPFIPGNICEATRCTLQDWLAATSGWAGFVAAVVASAFVFGQLSEQRKQTAFLLGDSVPTMTLAQPAQAGIAISFQFLNWNRRPVSLHKVKIYPEKGGPACPNPVLVKYRSISSESSNWKDAPLDGDGKFTPGMGLLGWINRQSAPNGWWVELHFPAEAFLGFPLDYETTYIVDFGAAQDDTNGNPRWLNLKVPVVSAYLSKCA